jgi:hypothetical protein
MDKTKLIEVILSEWTANFQNGDKSTKGAKTRFTDLFQKWKNAGAAFEDLYDTYLPKAIKVHLPKARVLKDTYVKFGKKTGKSFQEYTDEWNAKINSDATEIFFEFFPIPSEDDGEPKVYGNMSASEYRAQRRYADQFPILNTKELVKAWREQKEYNLDIEEALKNVLGENNESDS